MSFVNQGSDKHFACPNCGATDCFYEVGRVSYTSTIDYIDENGVIHWSGESDFGDDMKHQCFKCDNCDHKFDKKAFDPKERIAAAMADLDALTKEFG